MSVKSLASLNTWIKAKGFALRVYREVVPLFPAEEKWSMAQQIRRSANSIPANIAEGYGRFHYQDNIRFCYIARGSLEETLIHLVMCVELNYIPKSLFDSLAEDGEKLTQLINGYIGYLKRSKQGKNIREDEALYDAEDNSQLPTPDSPITS
ncbi:MAG: four helix bundle protein [Anaerolineae bacterium]|jgi:four helix bundle protein|nr:four helix bundle protein [Anaerolineae bacterium]MBT3713859.1 four helix bundle protein [Anaerolineae bacterium]MBT4312502.1 four helix bundle protein [Anaerolineae bacterium]MBT4458760.1 four helix bundle protein [Anaerolineae bacterium]MBT4842230.1 four helix bundle protein [Anaerolineae bacterium]